MTRIPLSWPRSLPLVAKKDLAKSGRLVHVQTRASPYSEARSCYPGVLRRLNKGANIGVK